MSDDRLTFIGSSSCGIIATGANQTVSLANDSWLVVQNASKSPLNVVIKGNDANITINDNSISGYSGNGINLLGGYMGTLDASHNWWGSASGPCNPIARRSSTGWTSPGSLP